PVRGHALPLAVAGPTGGVQRAGQDAVGREVVDGRVAGLQHPDGREGDGDGLTPEDDLALAAHRLDPRRAGVVPHRFLPGTGPYRHRFHGLAMWGTMVILDEHGKRLADAIEGAVPGWVERSVRRRLGDGGIEPGAVTAA